MLRPEQVQPLLRGSFGRDSYVYAESCPSTQRLAAPDAPHGTVAVAEHQTEGRGRLGRTWVDEPGASLLFSVVLRPTRPVQDWPTLTGVVGEAAADAVAALTALRPAIKPPNDLLLDGRKLAGILAEAQEGRIVLGIGVNVAAEPYPGSAALGAETDRAALLAELLVRLERAFAVWEAIRPATRADAGRILEIFAAARAAQGLGSPPPERVPGWLDRVFAGEVWLAGDEGFTAIEGGVLDYLYVDPRAQGRFVGTALLALAKQRRPDGFELWVFQHLGRTRRFYERRGLELARLTDGSGNLERLPDALYRWRPPTATAP
jgi:BirA family biotin operon repressor/biotin-[acetyl-CoA-carboxylase] ligase